MSNVSIMALLDFLNRKKEVEKAKKKSSSQDLNVQKNKELKGEKTKEQKEIKPSLGKSIKQKNFSYEVIKEPHVSEKSTVLNQSNKYVFKVYSTANKPEVKKSVEGIYGVDVLDVNIIKIPKKKRRIGRTEGFRKCFVKAVVTIKEGQKIDIF